MLVLERWPLLVPLAVVLTIRTTSGRYTLDSFTGKQYSAREVLQDARLSFPHASLELVSDAVTGARYQPDDLIPDNTEVHVLSNQPVDA